MAMTRWDPLREIERLRDEMDRFLGESLGRTGAVPERLSTFPVDVYQTGNEVVVKAAVPGMKPEDVKIEALGNTLTISGDRKEEKETKEENYTLREMRVGRFQRQILLPTAVEADAAQAKFENGVLTLTLPISEKAKPKTIPVRH